MLNTAYLGRAHIYTKLGMTITVHNVLKNNKKINTAFKIKGNIQVKYIWVK